MINEYPQPIRILVQYREGRFYFTSEDIEGLWLSGKDPVTLFSDLIPAIQYLLKENHGFDIAQSATTLG